MQHEITARDFGMQIKGGFYAWPGGYPIYAMTSDCGALCPACCKSEARQIVPSIKQGLNDGWRVVCFDINYEWLIYCDHCGGQIESAYEVIEND